MEDTPKHSMTYDYDRGCRQWVTIVTCGDSEPYGILREDPLKETDYLKFDCYRCGRSIVLLPGIQKFDAIEAARSAMVMAQLVLDHYKGPIPFFLAWVDSKRRPLG